MSYYKMFRCRMIPDGMLIPVWMRAHSPNCSEALNHLFLNAQNNSGLALFILDTLHTSQFFICKFSFLGRFYVLFCFFGFACVLFFVAYVFCPVYAAEPCHFDITTAVLVHAYHVLRSLSQ